ncbi:hypothetical protein [Rhodanobacter sp. T12-5]|uniref:hypothetical protein n=1 Tax=Rhodanobacter sp. T12-5 TaxID=2024611 RepID=UPI0011EE10CA|nr:hypothetical protein [Rhodanobacter sp. T12-5]KAA0070077.1 hypothetical protein CIW53_08280 [Rhodanobacter sp. T12-5]
MMIPNKQPLAEPVMPAANNTPPVAESAVVDEDGLTHSDYNLLPLAVRSLDHYVAREDEGERFHIR